MLSISPNVLRYRLTVILPPLHDFGCQKFLEIQNPLGKSNGKKWSQILKLIVIKDVKSPRKKIVFGQILSSSYI